MDVGNADIVCDCMDAGGRATHRYMDVANQNNAGAVVDGAVAENKYLSPEKEKHLATI